MTMTALSRVLMTAVLALGCAQSGRGLGTAAGAAPRDPTAPSTLLPEGYQAEAGCRKRDRLWERIVASRYEALPEPASVRFLSLAPRFLRNKVESRGDEAPPGHEKAIHARGVVARVRFDAAGPTGLTGLFAAAEVCGLMRFSLTQPPGDVAPGLALKLFVDGEPSQNVSALVALDGQGDNYNFFANEMSTMVGPSSQMKGKISSLLFRIVTRHPRALGVAGFARVNPDGSAVAKPLYPYLLHFVPAEMLQTLFPSEKHNPLEDVLGLTPSTLSSAAGVVYEVWAPVPKVNSAAGAQAALAGVEKGSTRRQDGSTLVGRLTLEERPVASTFGDRQLFFAHERYENE